MLNKCQPKNRTKYEKLCVVSVIIILKKVLVKLEKLKGIVKDGLLIHYQSIKKTANILLMEVLKKAKKIS